MRRREEELTEEHEEGTAFRSAEPGLAAGPVRMPPALSAQSIMGMQAGVGNAAVARALTSGPTLARLEISESEKERLNVPDDEKAGMTGLNEAEVKDRSGATDKAATAPEGVSMAADPEFEAAGQSFERKLGALAFSHPASKRATDKMAETAKQLMTDIVGKWDDKEPKMIEMCRNIGSDNPGWSGSVGKVAKDIMAVIENGNTAERMAAMESFYMEVIGKGLTQTDPDAIDDLIEKATAAGAKKSSLRARRAPGANPWATVKMPDRGTQEGDAINDQWHTRADRNASGHDIHPEDRSKRTLADTGIEMSDREKAVAKAEDPEWDESKPLKWAEGVRIWVMNEHDKWVRAMRKMSLPLGAGPSGTTNKVMNAAEVLGVDDMKDARMAAIGYLLPAGHHTLVEIMTGAAKWVPFKATPQMYAEIEPLSEEDYEQCKEGGKFPHELHPPPATS